MFRRWPVWAINTWAAMSEHALAIRKVSQRETMARKGDPKQVADVGKNRRSSLTLPLVAPDAELLLAGGTRPRLGLADGTKQFLQTASGGNEVGESRLYIHARGELGRRSRRTASNTPRLLLSGRKTAQAHGHSRTPDDLHG